MASGVRRSTLLNPTSKSNSPSRLCLRSRKKVVLKVFLHDVYVPVGMVGEDELLDDDLQRSSGPENTNNLGEGGRPLRL